MNAQAKKAYIKSPFHCPFCDSKRITNDAYNAELQQQTVSCMDCGQVWNEWLKIVDVTAVK
jgi:transcription elongation factor Elf1